MKKLYLFIAILIAYFSNGIQQVVAQSFTRIQSSPVTNSIGDSRSVNWVDINNDGLIDLQITNGPQVGQNNFLYLNNGNGQFSQEVGTPISSDSLPSDGATWADSDNDGDLDCIVVNYYDSNNVFYTNAGNGLFTQVNTSVITSDKGYSETATWGDYDNDGLVDLFVANSAGSKKNFLYHNNGNNSFTKLTAGAVANDAFESRCASWTDIDLDGDVDLFVTNESNQNENLYRNDGNGNFTKITAGPLVTSGGRTMSASWADYDNDGDLDVFLSNDRANNLLFRNEGNFIFTKVGADTVSRSGGNSFSSAWSDIDNDGDLDLFVTNAFWTTKKQVNFLYLNNGAGGFSRISNTAPATDSSWSYGCAFGDYDNDGFEDLAVATVRYGNEDQPNFLYHNNGNANHWASFTLIGNTSNKAAIGAKVRARSMMNGVPVWQLREISAQSSYCGQNDLRVHFGFGATTIIDSLKIEWPSGTVDLCTALSTDSFYYFTEGQCVVNSRKPTTYHSGFILDSVYPNPASQNLFFQYSAPQKGKIEIAVLDTYGKSVLKKNICSERTGENAAHISIEKLPKGTYNLILKYKSETVKSRFLKF